jgi:hypothetical protein
MSKADGLCEVRRVILEELANVDSQSRLDAYDFTAKIEDGMVLVKNKSGGSTSFKFQDALCIAHWIVKMCGEPGVDFPDTTKATGDATAGGEA